MNAAHASRRRLIANASSAPDQDEQLRTIAAQFGLDPDAVAQTVTGLVGAGIPRGEARQRAITSALLLWPLTRHQSSPQPEGLTMHHDDEIRLDDDFDETVARYGLDADRIHRRIEELEASGMSRGEARLRAVVNAMLVVLKPERNNPRA